VSYLYQPGELEGGTKRATDPIWSLIVHQIERSVTKPNAPVVYYLSDDPKRLVHAHSIHPVALTAQYLHFVHVLFPSE